MSSHNGRAMGSKHGKPKRLPKQIRSDEPIWIFVGRYTALSGWKSTRKSWFVYNLCEQKNAWTIINGCAFWKQFTMCTVYLDVCVCISNTKYIKYRFVLLSAQYMHAHNGIVYLIAIHQQFFFAVIVSFCVLLQTFQTDLLDIFMSFIRIMWVCSLSCCFFLGFSPIPKQNCIENANSEQQKNRSK